MEGGYKPYHWTGLGYNEFRNVIPKRRREWEGMVVPHLEKKKPNQHFVPVKNGAVSNQNDATKFGSYQDMIYTDDNQCMKSPYRSQRFDYKPPEQVKGPPPNAPTNVSAEATSTDTIFVSWDSVLTATYYSLYRDGSLIYQTSSTSYEDFGLESDTTYTYAVSATNFWGTSNFGSTSGHTFEEPLEAIFSDDCSSLSGWSVISTVQQEFDSRSTFHLSGAGYMSIVKSISTYTNFYTVTLVVYCDNLLEYPNGSFKPMFHNGVGHPVLYFNSNGLYIGDTSESVKKISDVTLDTWQTWKFVVNMESHTMDIHLNNVPIATGETFYPNTDDPGIAFIWCELRDETTSVYIDSFLITAT